MTTSFTSLPIVDLSPLASGAASEDELVALASELNSVFSTVGFAYLVNAPISFSHEDIFGMAADFFSLPEEVKMSVAKKTFRRTNVNTYRGYFPTQPDADPQNLKSGFEVGPAYQVPPSSQASSASLFKLTEANCFPAEYRQREQLETLYAELSSLSNTLLALLASSLKRNPAVFTSIMQHSVSTLRLLHYPQTQTSEGEESLGTDGEASPKLSCTPHTDSGLLTLLHQDSVGGLEVRNADGVWIPAPYVPDSLVVNVGDLMSQMSEGHFVATMHRVRSSGLERFSVPFFCEPGVDALVGLERKMRCEEFVLKKMGTWVEFQDLASAQITASG